MSMSKDQIRQIQKHLISALDAAGQLENLLDKTGRGIFATALENVAFGMESGTLEIRKLCESYMSCVPTVGERPLLKQMEVTGSVDSNEYGWLRIRLNTLLPHCRFKTPVWYTDTITRLLDQYERRNGKLPMLEEALVVIEEHCDIESRQVYDQDNKGWKMVPNAIKGRLIQNDDQFSLSVCLLSRRSPDPHCSIYILPLADAGDFFVLRMEKYPFFD